MKLRSLTFLGFSALLLAGCPENTYPAGEKDAYPLTDARVFYQVSEQKSVKSEHAKAEELRRQLADPNLPAAQRQAVATQYNDQAKKEKDEQDSIDKTRPIIAKALGFLFGSPERPQRPIAASGGKVTLPPGIFSPTSGPLEEVGSPLDTGRRLYKQHCMHCHGFYGFGDGPTANFLLPKPRDFRYGLVKFTSTKGGFRPVHDDLVRTIAQGVQGTMMPAFGPSEGVPRIGIFAGHAGPPGFDVDAVATYIEVLLMRGSVEQQLVAKWVDDGELNPDNAQSAVDTILGEWQAANDNVVKPETQRPQDFAASAANGNTLFSGKAGCVKCHGKHGLGVDSPKEDEAMPDQLNNYSLPSMPMNLTLGIYRGGRRPIDLYRRVFAGVKGTPMPGQAGNLTSDEMWNVVDYVYQLGMPKQAE